MNFHSISQFRHFYLNVKSIKRIVAGTKRSYRLAKWEISMRVSISIHMSRLALIYGATLCQFGKPRNILAAKLEVRDKCRNKIYSRFSRVSCSVPLSIEIRRRRNDGPLNISAVSHLAPLISDSSTFMNLLKNNIVRGKRFIMSIIILYACIISNNSYIL